MSQHRDKAKAPYASLDGVSSRAAHPGPPKSRPPVYNGAELHVHPHRSPAGVVPAERTLVRIFLRRYVIWCARARRFDRLRNALDLLIEVA